MLAVALGLCWNVSFAMDNLYVFVFKNGLAQQNIAISVGGQQRVTNEFGLANFELDAGEYEISYFKNGELFALTEFNLQADQQSQVFLTLTKEGKENVELDLPLSAYSQQFEQKDIKQQLGPKGKLQLKLLDSKSNKPVEGARLYFKGYAIDAKSDAQGMVSIDLSEAKYDISVVHPKYVMRVLKDVEVGADKTNSQEIKLVKANIQLEEYVVTAPSVEGSIASTFTEMKESNVIGEVLSSEEFTKSGDASAADALKRVTGITIVDGKYVYVRGLGERYSVVLLNDLYVPSPEPTKRVVPLDIFPSSVIQSMDIQKTYSVDLPGTFAGGTVLINSKDIPEEDNYIQLGVSSSVDEFTLHHAYTNSDNDKGLPDDIIKKSSNFQELTRGFPGVPGYTQEELNAINAASVNYRSYNLQSKRLYPSKKISFDVGQSFKTSNGLKWGFVGTLYYADSAKLKKGIKRSAYFNTDTGIITSGEQSDYQQTTINDKIGGLLSMGIDNQHGQKLKYTLLHIRDNEDETIFSQKDGGPAGPGIDDQQRTHYEYKEKTVTAHQLNGEHDLKLGYFKTDILDNIKINWAAEVASASRLLPGSVEYIYEKTSNVTDFTLNKDILYEYSDLKDGLYNFRTDFRLPYKHNSNENFTSFGMFVYLKSRTLDNRRFTNRHLLGTDVFEDIDSVLTQEAVDNDNLHFLSTYRPDDAYTAKQNVWSFYAKQLYSIRKNLDVMGGIRSEISKQQLIDSQTQVPYDPLETNDLLASLSLNYSINDENKIRLGFANTLTRPDFRDFSKNRSIDAVTEDIYFGNPDLTYTKINNLDLKYEWYLSYEEILSLGVFVKDFTNPIETILVPDANSQTGKKKGSPVNALGALSKGFEFGIRKKLGFLGRSFSNYFVASNLAVIDSKIRLEKNSTDIFIKRLTTRDRPMQGQSPYVINFNIGYDNINTGRSAVLLFNQFGKRISALGTDGAPDYYEYPFSKLDFVVKWRLNDTYDEQVKKIGYNIDFKVTNILNSKQITREGSALIESYRPPRTFSLSFSMKY